MLMLEFASGWHAIWAVSVRCFIKASFRKNKHIGLFAEPATQAAHEATNHSPAPMLLLDIASHYFLCDRRMPHLLSFDENHH